MYLTYALLTDNCVCHRLLVCRNIAGEEKATHARKITDAKTGGFKKDRNKSFKVCNCYISNNDFIFKFDFSISNTDRIIGYLFPLCILKTV